MVSSKEMIALFIALLARFSWTKYFNFASKSNIFTKIVKVSYYELIVEKT